ncbi:NAD(P)H-hydrate dehydratase [Pedobacter helvus]|uniref:Bifunctional NAD(P)H-hydrate repair enzyme n=1 Tax=Pedobacter helvus TaxID=2563444 RepID=A0ABW9JFS1_9SPHI|nr:NAD(P)H-hydrate dehydratase [Pedobacter ureilyticus]
MQNLLIASQIKAVDAYTIQHEPIKSIDLMERAAEAFMQLFLARYTNPKTTIWVFCGQGNNGGDGLAIARLLYQKGYKHIKVFLSDYSQHASTDYLKNLARLEKAYPEIPIRRTLEEVQLSKDDIVVDAILGSGLNKPLTGDYEKLAWFINASKAKVVAVDVPTGFKSEGEIDPIYKGIRADLVITFQLPKINFFFPESGNALATFKVVPIGLAEDYMASLPSQWKLITATFIRKTIVPRKRFSHKGTYGHALVIAGNTQTMGAALLSAGACLHTGAGLVSACISAAGLIALNVSLPEVMYLSREELATTDLKKYQAIAIGPGLGVEESQQKLLKRLLQQNKPLVIDADALNICATQPSLQSQIPAQSILTPHVKEFDRLFGVHHNWWQRVQTAKQKAQELQVTVVLKNQYTFVCLPNGDVCINTTGNPAMAQGGMGDVLTGMIVSFLAQGYAAETAAILAVYLHGKTGDELAKTDGVVSASLLSANLPKTLKKISDMDA